MTDPKPNTVMISSTARDLPEHRQAAMDACLGLGLQPVMMEHLPALDADAIDASLRMVEESTVYLGIFAHRYGYVPGDHNPKHISITEMEYDRAAELGRPRLLFVVQEPHTPELEREAEHPDKLAAFRERVLTDRVVKFFRSPDNLRAHITQALAHWLELRLTWMPQPVPERGTLLDRHTLPPGSRRVFAPSPTFVGRAPDMVALADSLLHGGDGAATVITPAAAATGAGGIGKTQLAIEFMHRYGRCFYGVHWVNLTGVTGEDAAAAPAFHAEIAECGKAMGLQGFPQELPDQVHLTLAYWRKTPPRLVILDNAESPGVVQAVLPHLAGACVLVTSRWGEGQDWATIGVTPCGLETLARSESLELLRRLAPHLESVPDADLERLADRLGDYPLALDLAGRYLHGMRRDGLSVAAYLERLDKTGSPLDHVSLRDWAQRASQTNPTGHDTDVAATFTLSWAQVDNPLAGALFRACGYLAPNTPIPPEVLRRLAEGDGEALVLALNQLVNYGLLAPDREDDALLTIHPLLADFARSLDPPDSPLSSSAGEGGRGGEVLEPLADALVRLTTEAGKTGLPAAFAPLRPHVERVAAHAEDAGLERAGVLWNNLGYYLNNMLADHAGARAAYERALRIDRKSVV